MFGHLDLKEELKTLSLKMRKAEDNIISEANIILKKDLLSDRKILENLKHYKSSFEAADEENLDPSLVFSQAEIKRIAVLYRLKFLEKNFYKPEIPYESILRIENLNLTFGKEIKEFKILAPYDSFTDKNSIRNALLFVPTNYDNYYLVHSWGKSLKKNRKLKFWPMRNFETLILTVVLVTLSIAVSLPTRLITLDHKAGYWSGYRAAAFFHLLIFDLGVTVYFTFAFAKNFSSTVWNRYRDFDREFL